MKNTEIFENLEHTGVYIVDKETFITYYENPIAKKYSVKDRIGKPCYSIHGNTSMCSSCPIRNHNRSSFVNRTDHGMVFIVQSEETIWDGHPSYLITVKKYEDLQFKTEKEKSIARMGRALQQSVNVYTEINMETLEYNQINLKDSEHYSVESSGMYDPAFEHMCNNEIHPDDVPNVRKYMAPEVLKAYVSDSNGPKEVSVRYKLKNSNPVKLMESRAIFIRDELPHYVVSLATDVTESTLLTEERNSLSKIVNNINAGIYVFESKGDEIKIVAANNSILEMLGRTQTDVDSLCSENIMKYIHPEDYPIIKSSISKLKVPNTSLNYEYRSLNIKTKDYIWLSANGHSIEMPDGSVTVYVYYKDITDEKKLKKIQTDLELEKAANKAKSDFMSTMSHDMRTPLNAIINLAVMSHDDIDNKELLISDLDKIQLSGSFLLGLINDILDLNKIDSGKMTLNPGVYSYMEFQNYIDSVFAPLCEKKDINFVWKKGNTSYDLWIDKIRFNQLFFNILSNAAKYTNPGGTVTFSVIADDIVDDALITDFLIEDTGIGMSKEFLEKIFEPFEREDRVHAYIGSGLGMTISKRIVDLMGGTISVKSTLGKGTTIKIHLSLPIATSEQSAAANEFKYVKPNNHVPSKNKILVVEDHPLNAEIICRLLDKHGYIYDCVENGQLALEKIKQCYPWDYSAILMDVRMPVMDGLTATKRIRNLNSSYGKEVPIIAMTANAYESDIKDSLDSGMNAHLSKPIDSKVLYETLEKFV